MASFRATREYLFGRQFERKLANLLQQQGWHIIPSYDYAGDNRDKPPKMQGLYTAFVLPDLDVSKGGKRRWVEAKAKDKSTLYRKMGVHEHGIPARHYEDYLRVEAESGAPVYLFVYEANTGVILYERLSELPISHRYGGGKMSRGGMVFFPRDAFRVFNATGGRAR